ncbi:hypothetical protein ABFS82_02G037100 [Erythranthe guttata]|uniref:Glycosyltransferase n=1 Tax=Erythranthe guttata TaxID=4155 RepID=A0A022RD54_ERYGU|nr:PREDICTED: scopoletin glucosyltransferase-like [Erythranthe guttata]EYU37648.1 hypothetical protein MIMGU_mgv1a005507mg [Erythranthe guttata]|eukprot:XP_012836921.1 PREDICTED: scopoletin glucosyltransferase-like [Erythranthe guttata]
MDSETRQLLSIYFIPVMAPGHMIPMIDIARQFARLGAKSTIITTSSNASQFSQTIERDRRNGSQISISLVKFPCREAGLPDGCENLSSTTTLEMSMNFMKAIDLLREPVEKLLHEKGNRPDCIVAGAFFSWANDVALRLNIPRLTFYGTGFFPMCVYRSLRDNKPHEKVGSDFEEFVVPGLPDEVRISRRQIPDQLKDGDNYNNNPMAEFVRKVLESELASYGKIVNSFYEMEPAYAEHYKGLDGGRAWHIGPVSLFNKSDEDKACRGKESSCNEYCSSWLDSKKPNSVLYVCFGSMAFFQTPQLHEIAKGLENSGREFVWAVKENAQLDEEFEARIEGRGLIIRGWAPQVQILDHEAVGGFVTHCGWNSLLEGVAAGVPMITWPLSAEQFFNEKLVAEILKTGIPVGAREWTKRTDEREVIKGESIERAVAQLMGGEEEAERMRIRAREFGDLAKMAVQEGGSSDIDLKSLMEELRMFHR